MKASRLTKILVILLLALLHPEASGEKAKRPNVLIIAVDDFDVEDLRSASRFNLPRQNAPSYTGLRVVIYLDRLVGQD